MTTTQMWAKTYIPSITVDGVIVPVLNEPFVNLDAGLWPKHQRICTCIKSYQVCKLPP